jgi:hypothetical protein
MKLTLIQKNQHSIPTYARAHDAFNLQGVVAGPAAVWLIMDSDGGQSGGIGNYPDASDSHGSFGGNVVGCNGHTELVQPRN